MDIKIFRSIKEISPLLWDSIISNQSSPIIKNYAFLSAVEDSNLLDVNYWYILFFEKSKLIGHAALFSMYNYIGESATGKIKNFICKIEKRFPHFLRLKLIVCGTPVATCSNVLTISDEVKSKNILLKLDEIVNRIAKQEKAHIILYRDFNNDNFKNMDILRKLSYKKASSLPTTFFDVKWDSFDEYVNSFKSSSKAKIKKNLKKFRNGDLVVEICYDFFRYSDKICELYRNVYKKAEAKFEKLTARFFYNINKNLDKNTKAILVWKDQKIIAFELILEWGQFLTPLYVGIDYEFNDQYKLYFNMLYQIIKLGIESGKKTIEIGQTCYYPKLKLGARYGNLFMYIKFRNNFVNFILKPFMFFIFPEIDYNNVKKDN